MKKMDVLKMTDMELDSKVKIQGTQYDRKRKISDKLIKKMKSMWKRNKTVSEIASKFGLNYNTVRYNVDPVYKMEFNKKRSGAHTGVDHITVLNRVAYKRELVAAGKIKV